MNPGAGMTDTEREHATISFQEGKALEEPTEPEPVVLLEIYPEMGISSLRNVLGDFSPGEVSWRTNGRNLQLVTRAR